MDTYDSSEASFWHFVRGTYIEPLSLHRYVAGGTLCDEPHEREDIPAWVGDVLAYEHTHDPMPRTRARQLTLAASPATHVRLVYGDDATVRAYARACDKLKPYIRRGVLGKYTYPVVARLGSCATSLDPAVANPRRGMLIDLRHHSETVTKRADTHDAYMITSTPAPVIPALDLLRNEPSDWPQVLLRLNDEFKRLARLGLAFDADDFTIDRNVRLYGRWESKLFLCDFTLRTVDVNNTNTMRLFWARLASDDHVPEYIRDEVARHAPGFDEAERRLRALM